MTWYWILELIGTAAFAVSGALTGIKKHMDIFGVVILGLTTAVGGGVIRDLVLGLTPPMTFRDPTYALLAAAVSILAFLPPVRGLILRSSRVYESVMLVLDSVGLGIFTTVGIKTAFSADPECGMFLLVFVGVITGVGGGILRDVLAGDTPYIFVKHIYACASLTGALICALLWETATPFFAMLAGTVVVIAVRLLSARFKWNLPRA